MQRAIVLLVAIISIGSSLADGFAAAPGRGTWRCTRPQRAGLPSVPASVPASAMATPTPDDTPAAQSLATDSELATRIAALERQIADITQQRAQRLAQEAQRPGVSGWLSVEAGGGGARIGVRGSWDD